MSDSASKTPLKLPAEEISKKIEEAGPDSLSNNEDDSEGQPDQPDGEK